MPSPDQSALFDFATTESKITKLAPLPSDPNVIRIYVDDRVAARLPNSDIEALDLQPDAPFTNDIALAIDQCIARNKVRKKALALLSRRAYTIAALRERLEKNEFDDARIDEIIAEFVDDGWLDDRAFAGQYLDELLGKKPAGEALLLQKLMNRGVPEGVADAAIREAMRERDPIEAAFEAAEAKLRKRHDDDRATNLRNIDQFLARRGFDAEVRETVLRRLDLIDDAADMMP